MASWTWVAWPGDGENYSLLNFSLTDRSLLLVNLKIEKLKMK